MEEREFFGKRESAVKLISLFGDFPRRSKILYQMRFKEIEI